MVPYYTNYHIGTQWGRVRKTKIHSSPESKFAKNITLLNQVSQKWTKTSTHTAKVWLAVFSNLAPLLGWFSKIACFCTLFLRSRADRRSKQWTFSWNLRQARGSEFYYSILLPSILHSLGSLRAQTKGYQLIWLVANAI